MTIAAWLRVGFLRYLGPLPPLPWEDVLRQLQQRLEGLPLPEHIEASLRQRYAQVQADVQEWTGLHRWINGKVLLEAFLYPQVFSPLGVSQVRMRDELIAAGMSRVPGELGDLAERWSSAMP